MPPIASLPPSVRAVVFDAYGTLFDVHSAVVRHAAAVGPEAARLSELWRTKQLEYSWVLSLAERYEPFWILTDKALDYALARCASADPALKPLLLDAYRKLDAYPEVPAVLTALRERGYRTAILSNGDPGMLAEAVASAGIDSLLDAVLSVDAAKTFKTNPRAYQLALSAFDLKAPEIVFVSSNRWDVAGAAAFGFTAVWVNRAGLPDEYVGLDPMAVVQNLAGLDILSAGLAPGSLGLGLPSSRPPV
jgi:2-haloacid dehalogenase